MASETEVHEILVLGGNFGGLATAHNLLRNTIPALQNLGKTLSYHITLVTPNTHFFFKPAAPRALTKPALLESGKIWKPLTEAFEQYPADAVTLVHAVATSLDPTKRTVTVSWRTPGEPDKLLPYDSLVIATGTTSTSPLWGIHDDQELTPEAFKSVRATLTSTKAKTVLVGGGGIVGIEVTGEIGSAFPSLEITLVSGSDRLLPRETPTLGARAQEVLEKKLGVSVVHGLKIGKVVDAKDEAGNMTQTVTLSDGTTLTVDLYIDATGAVPNSQFLPAAWLDKTGRVLARDGYFRVKGDGDDKAKGVYVVGDIAAGLRGTLFELKAMVVTACSALGADVAKQLGVPVASSGVLGSLLAPIRGCQSPLKEKEYKPLKDTFMVPIGPDGGVGLVLGFNSPSWLVRSSKAKNYLVEKVDSIILGAEW